jgi:hypothetical protein
VCVLIFNAALSPLRCAHGYFLRSSVLDVRVILPATSCGVFRHFIVRVLLAHHTERVVCSATQCVRADLQFCPVAITLCPWLLPALCST